jgi:phosphopantetheinyl transferase
MHHYAYHKRSWDILTLARKSYPWLLESLFSVESIEVRYWLLEYLNREYSYYGRLEKNNEGQPIPILTPEKVYWSLSHSDNFVAYIIASYPVGIDIVDVVIRDPSLLESHSEAEYLLLGGKDWYNFYILWSAKETIIKLCGWALDDMCDIHLREISGESEYIFEFSWEIHKINIIKEINHILSYTF